MIDGVSWDEIYEAASREAFTYVSMLLARFKLEAVSKRVRTCARSGWNSNDIV